MSKQKVVVIVGPTAVGKTKTSIALAKAFNGQIISGDSMQIYRGMDIGTAKVTQDEMDGIVHYQIDCCDFKEPYSVMNFQQDVRNHIKKIASQGCLPIIAGGTGLYIKAALYDYDFETEERKSDTKEKYQLLTNEELYTYLEKIDPISAKNTHMNNRRRVLRAIEIYETTGTTKSSQEALQKHEMLYDVLFIGLDLERSILYERINQRVDEMFALGLMKEFNELIHKGATRQMQSMKAIGYKELFDYIEGKCTFEEAKEKICLDSRRYAKRQMTWFRNQMPVSWLQVDLKCYENTLNQAIQLTDVFLKG